MAGTVGIAVNLVGLDQGAVVASLVITPNADNEYNSTSVTLAATNNTISVPSFAAGCLIIPNPLSTIAMVLKGASGDTGTALSPSQPTLLTFPSTPPSTLIIYCATLGSYPTTFAFF